MDGMDLCQIDLSATDPPPIGQEETKADVVSRGTREAPPRTAEVDSSASEPVLVSSSSQSGNWLREWSWRHVWCGLMRSRSTTCWMGTSYWRSTASTGSI